MKRIILIGIFGTSLAGFSQNLIKNPDFTTSEKVISKAQIHSADGWSDANGGSVDLFSASTCMASLGVPNNFMGNQASAGNYAGISAYYDDQRISLVKSLQNLDITSEKGYSQYSEYLQGELVEELKAGQVYSFSINVNLAEESGRAVNGLGAYFSNEKLEFKNNRALEFEPQIKSNEFISDEDGWSTISGNFIAKGGERYFSIGAFKGSFTVKSTVEAKKENDNKRAYYYVNGGTLSKVNNGDSDGDGVLDANDPCPNVYGTVNGCPDRDKDGVADKDDACPDVAGLPSLNGCVLSSEDLLFIQQTTEKVFFETASSVLSKEAKNELDGIAKLLKSHPEVKVSIKGHADSVGTEESNVILSRDRANSVKAYFVSKGVEDDHLAIEAHGETHPTQDNGTSEGRAQNRHVLISTSLYTVTKVDKK